MKKILALILTLTMVLGLGITAFAEADIYAGAYTEGGTNTTWAGTGPASITITLPTEKTAPTEDTTYIIYKVFDATNDGTSTAISYTLMNGKTTVPGTTFIADINGTVYHYDPDATVTAETEGAIQITLPDKTTKYIVPTGGTLTENEVAAIATYIGSDTPVCTAIVPKGETTVTVSGLEYGYYYITTTSGTVVTVDSTNPNANVDDKNILPPPPEKTIVEDFEGSVDDEGKNAIAQVGTTVPFSVDIVKTKGATNYVFHDVMSAGLEYKNDVKVYTVTSTTTGEGEDAVTTETETEVDKGASTWSDAPVAEGDTLTVTFVNAWLEALPDNTVIRIKYSATVTSDALSIEYAKNTATLDYGDGNTTEKDEVKVYNAKFTVTKQDGDGEALEGAGFVIAKTVADTSEGAEEGATKLVYYKITKTTTGEGEEAVTTSVVTWVDSIDEATEYKSDATGAVPAFTGLADGTYTLIEKTVPEGYNKAADSTFTIAADNYTAGNLEQAATVVNESGTELPSTGGIGTTIFYIVGGLLAVGAGVVLVTKKRMSKEDV